MTLIIKKVKLKALYFSLIKNIILFKDILNEKKDSTNK